MEGRLEKLVLQFLGDTLDADVLSEVSETSAPTGDLLNVGFGEPAPLPVRQADALHPAVTCHSLGLKNISLLQS